eukprot:m.8563 g.8563  ORF g.8563 m.8563 type:complete len:543 (+) comp2550_c0_seq1:54-1682(+)
MARLALVTLAVALAAPPTMASITGQYPPRDEVWDGRETVVVRKEVDLSALQRIMDEKSVLWNMSFSVGFYTDELGLQGVASGLNDRVTGSRVTPHHRFPVGSVTKPFTAAAILQLHDAGYLDIDDPIAGYVDPILRRLNGTTMLELWGGDTTCMKVTFRMLAGMRGGLHDYNDTWYEYETFFDGAHDVDPFELLHRLNKSWTCEPGTCGVYASTGFELLGLVLAEAAGVERWQDYNQLSVIPPDLRAGYPDLTFPGEGPCSKDPLIVHQYGTGSSMRKTKWGNMSQLNVTILDLYNDSCLNGWTCGNIAAAPSNVARFHYDLHHLRIVSNESLAAMMAFQPTTKGWDPQLYGLATMQTFPPEGREYLPDPTNISYTVGHAGADYGSIGMLAGYNTAYEFGIAMFTGSSANMNCSMPANFTAGSTTFFYDTLCPVYDEILQIVSNGEAQRLNCSACPMSSSIYSCMRQKNVEPSCKAYFDSIPCGQNNTIASDPLLCERCVYTYRHNSTSFCHSKYGVMEMCPPASATPRPSPPVSCDWSHIQ